MQHVILRQKHDPHMARARLLPEARAVHHQHMLLLQQIGHESQVILGNVERRMRVERSLRLDQADARRALGPVLGDVRAAA